MKITKSKLREMIKEELSEAGFGGEPTHRIVSAEPGIKTADQSIEWDEFGNTRDLDSAEDIIVALEDFIKRIKRLRKA